ncbi:YidC/Oxa1 family membrane protein insertase [Schumannella luteola]|uniref:Membrane protein insertase YidC n=1 Tax=Schumannella luteola TaxID=472059 RepID=A0A852YGR4_9MICO|nr:membrane protein insertase YidC [Schumannella luteola]NYH00481.1 YidC/Oxa1 family membrane protein insertase [Schumannella luteola]TPX06260.1 YidC/Oxa1 family membrane protein insertase [Schumannella luteola]
MNPFDIPVVAALLAAASNALNALGGVVTPAIAIVIVTVLIRLVLVPVNARVVRAEGHRRRIAPLLAALRKRHAKNPEKLQAATLELYQQEKVSPFAGMLPALAQAPVLGLVYGVFTHPEIAGATNPLFSATLGGAPLGEHPLDALLRLDPSAWVGVAVLAVIAVVAWFHRRSAQRLAIDPTAANSTLARVLSWMPFITVVFAAIVPLAAALYLAVSTAWTLGERAVLRRVIWPRLGVSTAALPAAG